MSTYTVYLDRRDSYLSWESIKSTIQDTSTKVATVFYNKLLFPVAIGVAAGIVDFSYTVPLAFFLYIVGVPFIEPDEEFAAELDDPWEVNIKGPIYEEILCRVIIQGTIKWVACKILPNKEVHLFSTYHVKLSVLVSVVASSVIFGAFHYYNDMGWAPVIISTVSGIMFGTLKERYGLLSSITCHMTTNTLCDLV